MLAPAKSIGSAVTAHTHHTETVDPTLAVWINDLLHDVLGWGPWTFVIVLGAAIVLVPVWLIFTGLKNQSIPEEEFEIGDE